MKVLITGSSGLLGRKLTSYCRKHFRVVPTFATIKNCEDAVKMDIRLTDKVEGILKTIKPDVIFHTAAMTNVDACEVNRKMAWLINVVGTKNLAEVAEGIDCKFVYLSTDYVFDGKKGMYKEADEPSPVNYYAKTKLEGEKVVERICRNYIIVRSSVLYGWHPTKKSFATWLINKLRSGSPVNIITDQFNSPTLTDDLAEMTVELVKRNQNGIFHCAGSERISRYEFAMKIAYVFGLDKGLIKKTTSDKLNWKASRPMDSSLDVSKISKIKKPLNIYDGLYKLKMDDNKLTSEDFRG